VLVKSYMNLLTSGPFIIYHMGYTVIGLWCSRSKSRDQYMIQQESMQKDHLKSAFELNHIIYFTVDHIDRWSTVDYTKKLSTTSTMDGTDISLTKAKGNIYVCTRNHRIVFSCFFVKLPLIRSLSWRQRGA